MNMYTNKAAVCCGWAGSLGWWDGITCHSPTDDGCTTECSAVAGDAGQTEWTRAWSKV